MNISPHVRNRLKTNQRLGPSDRDNLLFRIDSLRESSIRGVRLLSSPGQANTKLKVMTVPRWFIGDMHGEHRSERQRENHLAYLV